MSGFRLPTGWWHNIVVPPTLSGLKIKPQSGPFNGKKSDMAKGGGSKPPTKFQAGAVPQSLYNLGGDINYFRQHDLEPLLSTPLSLTNWALNAAGIPVQQTTPQGSFYNIQTYGGAGGGSADTPLPSGGKMAQGDIPQNPWSSGGDTASWYNWVNNNIGNYVYINGQPVQISNDNATMTKISQAQAGGQLSTSTQQTDLQKARGLYGQVAQQGQDLITQGKQTYGAGTDAFQYGMGLLQQAAAQNPDIQSALSQLPTYQQIMSTGLTPEQQAYITQATEAQKAGVTQQMNTMGLGSSSMLQEKLGAAGQAGAASAGSLIQGNIQAATGAAGAANQAVQTRINEQQILANAGINEQNVAVSEQTLGLNGMATGTNYLNTVATADVGMQAQLFQEAMSGYGVLGQLLDTQIKTYGVQLNVEGVKAQESGTAMTGAFQAYAAQQQADAQGFSGLLSGVGSLLGGKSGIGGLFGAGAGAAGGAAIAGGSTTAIGGAAAGAAGGAAAGGGAIAGIGSVVGSALTALGGLFCAVGREIFGTDNPEWFLLRDFLIFRCPRWVRRAYVCHAPALAEFLRGKPLTKMVLRQVVRWVLWVADV
jgi:hypothetical protein